jgi:hypothetical protein
MSGFAGGREGRGRGHSIAIRPVVKLARRTRKNEAFLIPIALLAGLTPCFGQEAPEHDTSYVVARMVQADDAQQKNLQHYRVIRTYELRKNDGGNAVEALVQVDYNGPAGKAIQVLEQRGSDGMFRRALQKVIEAEIRASNNKEGRNEARLIPENYCFRLIGTVMRDGRRCFVLELTPKRKSKYLVEGRAWIDSQDYALVALEGRSAASVSFWVGKPYITQSYEKVGDLWILAHNHSVADARLVGRIALTIETRNLERGGTKVALAPHRRLSGLVLD